MSTTFCQQLSILILIIKIKAKLWYDTRNIILFLSEQRGSMRTDQPVSHLPTKSRKLVILPLGSCEQHGSYLPIDTDLRIAQLLAEKLTNALPDSDTLLLPAIPFSCSWEH